MPEKLQLKIGGMSCSFCVNTITKAIGRIDGVGQVRVSLAHEEALIGYDPAKVGPAALRQTLRDIGYTVRDPRKVRSFEEQEAELQRGRIRLAAAGATVLVALWLMVVMWTGRSFALMPWVMLALALNLSFVVAWPYLRQAVASLRRGILNQHVLMEFGAFGGLAGGLIGFFVEDFPTADFLGAAIFITGYHLLSGFVSLKVRTRTSQAVRKLMALQLPAARIVRDGSEEEVSIEQVQPGDLVRIRPGESIPVDGEVVEGASSVDQSLVTGEPIPEEKVAGDEVIGGSINQSGTLVVQVTKVGEESFLAQVIRQVEEARALKPGIIVLVDRILKVYVPAVLGIAALAFVGWAAAGDPKRAVFAALAVGVMGYPCALGMATPLAMIRGGGMAAEKGILMRSAEAFQAFGRIDRMVLDKTGTITRGQPRVVRCVTAPGVARAELLRLAAAVEDPSEHPLGRAIVERAATEEIDVPWIEDFEALVGKGVKGRVEGREVVAGKPDIARDLRSGLGDLARTVEEFERRANTVIVVVADGHLMGVIAIADPIKPDARETVEDLRRRGIEPVMITGDNERAARAVAERVGITEVRAQVLPDQKAEEVRALQRAGHRVGMVGDGINDAPALMQADIGIAIGAGTDIAIESADVILVGQRLSGVVDAYEVGRRSYRKTKQNLALAFAFNGIGVPAATTGLVHPVWAMAAMAASVTAVLTNSFGARILAPRGYQRFDDPARIKEEENLELEEEAAPPDAGQEPEAVVPAPADAPHPAHLEVNLTGVHCGSCMERASGAVGRVDGVLRATPLLPLRRLRVDYSPARTDPAAIKARLEEVGYGVKEEVPS